MNSVTGFFIERLVSGQGLTSSPPHRIYLIAEQPSFQCELTLASLNISIPSDPYRELDGDWSVNIVNCSYEYTHPDVTWGDLEEVEIWGTAVVAADGDVLWFGPACNLNSPVTVPELTISPSIKLGRCQDG